MSSHELKGDCEGLQVYRDDYRNSVHIEGIDGEHGAKDSKDYTFDFAYNSNSTQDEVYKDIGEPVVTQAMDGFNCTVFAYGQTGSGKSYSMMGYGEDHGLIPKLNDDLWQRVNYTLERRERESVKHGAESAKVKEMGKIDFYDYRIVFRDL